MYKKSIFKKIVYVYVNSGYHPPFILSRAKTFFSRTLRNIIKIENYINNNIININEIA